MSVSARYGLHRQWEAEGNHSGFEEAAGCLQARSSIFACIRWYKADAGEEQAPAHALPSNVLFFLTLQHRQPWLQRVSEPGASKCGLRSNGHDHAATVHGRRYLALACLSGSRVNGLRRRRPVRARAGDKQPTSVTATGQLSRWARLGPPLPAPEPPAPRLGSSLRLSPPKGVPAPHGDVLSPQCRLRLPGMSGGLVTQWPSSEALLKGLVPGPSSSRAPPR